MSERLPKRRQLTLDRLREVLDYDRETGIFTWRFTGRKNNYAGKVAGSIHKIRASDKTEYVFINIDYVSHSGHILAWFYETGEYPETGIDHWDGNGANNRFANLRLATAHQNNCNRTALSKNKSGFKGVSESHPGRWVARIKANGKHHYLGAFRNKEDAAKAYETAAEQLHGEFARV